MTNMIVRSDLLKDWNGLIRNELSKYFDNAEIPTDDDEAETLYFNFLHRSIPKKPRTVHGDADIAVPEEVSNGFQNLIQKVKNGDDLNPHLSRKRKNINFKDEMLNDWGVHHFHLETTFLPNGLIKGTSEVLFALVDKDNFFCIDIYTHDDWSNQEVINEIHSLFPEQISRYKIQGINDISYKPTDDDITDFRKVGVNTVLKMDDGTIYSPPGGGYSTDRTSLQVTKAKDSWRKSIRQLESGLDKTILSHNDLSFKSDQVKCILVVEDGDLCIHLPELNKSIPLERKFPAL